MDAFKAEQLKAFQVSCNTDNQYGRAIQSTWTCNIENQHGRAIQTINMDVHASNQFKEFYMVYCVLYDEVNKSK